MVGIVMVGVAAWRPPQHPLGRRAVQRAGAGRAGNYDSGSTGRFGRQGYAFDMALSKPWGIGPAEFRNLRIPEEAHDSYANTFHVYGWGGAVIWDGCCC